MVRGLDKFKEYFAEYTGNYVIIGGTARDKFMEEAGLKPKGTHLTPIPAEEGLTSLSAILLDDEYYQYVIEHSEVEDGLHLAQKEAVICLKAKAFIDLNGLRERGNKIDRKKIRKHHTDIFRLGFTLESGDYFELPDGIKTDLQQYLHSAKNDLPGEELFESMGLGHIKPEEVYTQIKESFLPDIDY